MTHTALYLASALLCAVVVASSAQAWSTGGLSDDLANPNYGTHDWIADAALALQVRDVTPLQTTYHAEFLLGTEAPDDPAYGLDNTHHHVYYNKTGCIQDDIGAVNAAKMYDLTIDAIRNRSPATAVFYLGAMVHYISDVGVFGHTMGHDSDWGPEAHHADYEEATDSVLSPLARVPEAKLESIDPYNATIVLAKKITFGTTAIKPNVWMNGFYDWSNSTFRTSALASLNASVEAVAGAMDYAVKEFEELAPSGLGNLMLPFELPFLPEVREPFAPHKDQHFTQVSDSAVSPVAVVGLASSIAIVATSSIVFLFSRRANRKREGV